MPPTQILEERRIKGYFERWWQSSRIKGHDTACWLGNYISVNVTADKL